MVLRSAEAHHVLTESTLEDKTPQGMEHACSAGPAVSAVDTSENECLIADVPAVIYNVKGKQGNMQHDFALL